MKKSRYIDSQILAILKQAESGTPAPQLCREHGMSSFTFYKWRAKYADMGKLMMARLKEMELHWGVTEEAMHQRNILFMDKAGYVAELLRKL